MKYILLFLLFSSCSNKLHLKTSYDILYPKEINADELEYIMRTQDTNTFIIIDLRSEKDYDESHIPTAITLPTRKIKSVTNIENYKEKKLIFYDYSSINYFHIKNTIKRLQISNYSLLQNGYISYKEHLTNEKHLNEEK